MSELIHAYTKYRTQKALIRAQQRQELTELLEPYAAALGAEIDAERRTRRIEDISGTIGLKNKNFLYDMLRAYERSKQLTLPDVVESDSEKAYEVISKSVDVAFVSIGEENFTLGIDANGEVIVPDSWATDSKERRKVYRDLIKEINAV